MRRINVRGRQEFSEQITISQLYGSINDDNDVYVNGAISVNVIKEMDINTHVRIYANLCNKENGVLHVLNSWKKFIINQNSYYSFSLYCASVDRCFDIDELDYAEVYLVFNENES